MCSKNSLETLQTGSSRSNTVTGRIFLHCQHNQTEVYFSIDTVINEDDRLCVVQGAKIDVLKIKFNQCEGSIS